MRNTPIKHTAGEATRRAFTLVELLVVIGIIGLLIGLLVAAASNVLGNSARTRTAFLMQSIGNGIEQFKNDFTYYPPLLDGADLDSSANRLGVIDNVPATLYDANRRYHSLYSLTVYLVGIGDVNGQRADAATADPLAAGDPYDDEHPAADDGVPGPGFRSPGRDRSWGGAENRMNHAAPTSGRQYGPYVDVDEEALRLLDANEANNFGIGNDAAGLAIFVDPYDAPIRYYRHWPTRADVGGVVEPSLQRTPIELLNEETVTDALGNVGTLDAGLERDLLNAPYALLSAGPDGEFANGPTAMIEEPLGNAYQNTAALNNITDVQERKLLSRSLEDNVRFLPQ